MVARLISALPLACLATSVVAQLRVATWNVTNYSGSAITPARNAAFQTALYGIFQGRSVAPDVFVGQEFGTASALLTFQNVLNTAPGSPGDWAAAPFLNGPDTDSVLLYRTSRVTFVSVTRVGLGGTAPLPPRDLLRFDVSLAGYSGEGAILSIYSTHMKSGSTSSDQSRRLMEAEWIRADAESLPPGRHFLLAGDLNIQSSGQAAYQHLVSNQTNNAGRFFDPIATPGTWNNNISFRFVHTQDPWPSVNSGGMDDRLDQILISANLGDQAGFDYRGNAQIPYSTTTWNDPNHSYRSWGNDGTSFNTSLRVVGNAMVGSVIAQALVDSLGDRSGHLPVFLDLLAPPKIETTPRLDFGYVDQNAVATLPITVTNAGDTMRWGTNGVGSLRYSMTGQRAIPPAGTFIEPIGLGSNVHVVRLDTSQRGRVNGTVTILSNDPDQPERVVNVTGVVVGMLGSRPPRRP